MNYVKAAIKRALKSNEDRGVILLQDISGAEDNIKIWKTELEKCREAAEQCRKALEGMSES